jgi:signal peptidase II
MNGSQSLSRKARVFWPVALTLLLTDCATKRLAENTLGPEDVPHGVIGDVVQLTLSYNTSAAMGIDLGIWSRPILATLTLVALLVLGALYRKTASDDRTVAIALALLVGGAVGNLVDRLRSSRGVVDFLDLGIGAHRFWIFNVADIGVTMGAALLAWMLWKREGDQAAQSG